MAGLDALAGGLGGHQRRGSDRARGRPARAGRPRPGFSLLQEDDGRAAGAYRTGGAPTAFLLDPNLRVRATLPFTDGARVATDVAELVAELVWDDRRLREITSQAPLLVVPDVLDPEQCAWLIAVWEQQGNSQTGVESATGGGRAEQHDTQLKRRRDHIVGDPQRSRELATRIGRRVVPEPVQGVRVPGEPLRGLQDRLLPGGRPRVLRRPPRQPQPRDRAPSLRPHPQSQRARRTMSYASPSTGPSGTGRYRPAAGAALLFSCSHLHEVLDVTAGRRFVPVVVPVRGRGTPTGVRRRIPATTAPGQQFVDHRHCCIERSPRATASTSPLRDDRSWHGQVVRPFLASFHEGEPHFAGLPRRIPAL